MLGPEDTRCKRVRRIGLQNRDRRLSDDGAVVHLRPDDVHGASRELDASGKCACVRIKPFEGRQQRGMNVEHSVAPALHEVRCHQPHESRAGHEIDVKRLECGIEFGLERFAARKRLVVDGACGYASGLGLLETFGLGSVGKHASNLSRVVVRLGRRDERNHVGAPARDQNPNALFHRRHLTLLFWRAAPIRSCPSLQVSC